MLSALKDQENATTGTLRIGVTWDVALNWIEPATKRFNTRYPNLRVEVLCDCLDKVMQDLRVFRADVGVFAGRPRSTPALGSVIVTRFSRKKAAHPFWIARPTQGQSLLASAFEQEMLSESENQLAVKSTSLQESSTLPACSSAVCQSTDPQSERLYLRHKGRATSVAMPKVQRP